MGIFKKISDLARANVNALLDQWEDPKKLHDLAILELETSKKKAHQLLVSAKAALLIAHQQKERLTKQAQQLKDQAEHFLRISDEEAAKNALFKKQEIIQEKEIYDERLKNEQAAIDTVNRALRAIDQKISSIKSTSTIQESLTHLEKEDAFATFSRMEEKIDTTEREIEALTELLKATEKKDGADIPTAPSFDKHSDPTEIESELLAMKKKLND